MGMLGLEDTEKRAKTDETNLKSCQLGSQPAESQSYVNGTRVMNTCEYDYSVASSSDSWLTCIYRDIHMYMAHIGSFESSALRS